MSRNRRKSDRSLAVGVLTVCAVVVVAVGAYVKFAPADEIINYTDPDEIKGGAGVQMLVPNFREDTLHFDRTVVEVPDGVDRCVFAVNQYLRNVKAVPDSVEALTCSLYDEIATIDFNSDFERSYGTEDEMIIINGILSVMGQFEEISWVKFTVDGKEIESIGNLELTEPLGVLRLGPIENGS